MILTINISLVFMYLHENQKTKSMISRLIVRNIQGSVCGLYQELAPTLAEFESRSRINHELN